jgi:hypothetical protein
MARVSQKSNAQVTIRCYDPGGNGGGIHEWYDSLDGRVQAPVDAALETLANSRRPWPETLFEALKGDCYGLTEVRIAVVKDDDDDEEQDAEQYRILVWDDPSERIVTLLYGFKKEKTSDYSQPCRSALRRKDNVRKHHERARPCVFP